MRPGDVYMADLPQSDGREQSGMRPVLVLQDDGYAGHSPTVLIVPTTGTLAATRFVGTILMPATPGNGLTKDSVLLVFQFRAIDRSRFGRRLGATEPAILAQVYQTLDRLTGHP